MPALKVVENSIKIVRFASLYAKFNEVFYLGKYDLLRLKIC